ncbi:ABC transporter substrate-binding protein [Microbacterium soli]|uniref:ABC transporter substrate-binding protein n=1 Tax=Microbacterium soli TaxID=446075 RepID=A0ABP7NIK4_9MICO
MRITFGRGLTAAVFTIGLSLVATACSGPTPAPVDEGDDPGETFAPVTIRLALPTSVTSFSNSDIAVARELGYFDELGLTVETTNLKAGGDAVKGVVSGSFDIGGASIEPVINAYVTGANLNIIASYADRLVVDMVTSKSITDPAELAGKNLGVQEIGSFREVMTRMVLESVDLSQSDVSYVPTNADAIVSGLVAGQIQSGILQPEQLISAEEKDPDLHSLVNLFQIEPKYFYGTYFASQDWLKENPDAAVRFTQALTKAHRTMYDDEAKVVPVIAEETGFSEDIITQAWTVYMEDIEAFAKNEGLDQENIDYTLQRMDELGTLRPGATTDVSGLVDRGPITKAVENLGSIDGRS